jgi:hypothetical protein
MPFIRGRYHINPIAGAALEAAREAEDALTALHEGHQGNIESAGERTSTGVGSTKAPIHRIEIEAAEVVPSHSGRAQRGFVARIHRAGIAPGSSAQSGADHDVVDSPGTSGAQSKNNSQGGGAAQPAETHVFAHHQNLTDFLRGEFEKDSGQ